MRYKFSSLDPDEEKILIVADGRLVKILGKINLPIKIDGLIIPFQFFVMQALSQDLILGMDFLKKTKCQINCADNTVTFFDDLVGLNLLTNHRRATNLVRVSRNCRLPPQSETILQAYVSNITFDRHNVHDSFLLEALPSQSNQSIILARTLTVPRQAQVVCRVLNPSNAAIRLRKNKPIAQLTLIAHKDITTLPAEFSDPIPSPLSVSSLRATGAQSVTPQSFTPQSTPICIQQPTIHQQSTIQAQSAAHPPNPTPPPTLTDPNQTLTHVHTTPAAVLADLGISIDNDKLTTEQRADLTKLLADNADLFARGLHDLPGSDCPFFNIDTGDHKPIRQRPYKHSSDVRQKIGRQIAGMLKHNIIEESNSVWNSPCLLVSKSNTNERRFVVDYRR